MSQLFQNFFVPLHEKGDLSLTNRPTYAWILITNIMRNFLLVAKDWSPVRAIRELFLYL